MPRHLVALLLLAAFGLGSLMGPHPCGAGHADQEQESANPSCHEAEPTPTGLQLSDDTHHDGGDCCSALCQHVCHMTGIAEVEPIVFAISPVSDATAEPSGHGLPLFAHPIDHIPLA
jgi:hypothetical protein